MKSYNRIIVFTPHSHHTHTHHTHSHHTLTTHTHHTLTLCYPQVPICRSAQLMSSPLPDSPPHWSVRCLEPRPPRSHGKERGRRRGGSRGRVHSCWRSRLSCHWTSSASSSCPTTPSSSLTQISRTKVFTSSRQPTLAGRLKQQLKSP